MKTFRRLGITLALAGALSMAGPAPLASADANAQQQTVTSVSQFCDGLTRLVAYLEGLRPSPLRDFLLARARALQERYCASCNC